MAVYNKYILDTNILSNLLKNQEYQRKLLDLVTRKSMIFLSPVAYYETRRGLKKINALRQLKDLENVVKDFEYEEIDYRTWEIASDLWSMAAKSGLCGADDADILISAQALVLGAVVITHDGDIEKLIPNDYLKW